MLARGAVGGKDHWKKSFIFDIIWAFLEPLMLPWKDEHSEFDSDVYFF